MGDWRNAALQAAFWTYANSLRLEAKLCDIVLYVQGKKGAMVGYPAHKLLLISASKYFKLLFEREDLRNFCHFPHLSEDGLFTVLDIVYGREIADSVNLDDALMAARFLQVDCAVEELEAKRTELEAKARASPKLKIHSGATSQSGVKRKIDQSPHHQGDRTPSRDHDRNKHHAGMMQSQADAVEIRIFKNMKTDPGNDNTNDSDERLGGGEHSLPSHDSGQSPADPAGGDQESQDNNLTIIKTEPDVDLTMDDENNGQGMQQMGFDQGAMFPAQAYGQMHMDNVSGQNESGLFGDGQYSADSYGMGDASFGAYSGGDMSMQQHQDNKLRCDICGKVFATVGHLEEHRNTHTGGATNLHSNRTPDNTVKPLYKCDICHKSFKHAKTLKRHQFLHTGIRPYACDVCGKTFNRQDTLLGHRRLHFINQ